MVLQTTRRPVLTDSEKEEHDSFYAKFESFMSDTVERVADTHERLPEIEKAVAVIPGLKMTVEACLVATTSNSQAAISWAETYKRSTEDRREQDKRYDDLSKRFDQLVQNYQGKGQMPILSHYLVMVVMAIVTVASTFYFTKQSFEATREGVKINSGATRDVVREEAKEIKEKIDGQH